MELESEIKIEETVKNILREANMDEMTEFKVRLAAADRLGLDLSGDNEKMFIRSVIECFLVSTDESETGDCKEKDEEENRIICRLSNKITAGIVNFRGNPNLAIGEWDREKGMLLPYAEGGMNLPAEQWSIIKKSIPAVEEAISKLQSKLRPLPAAAHNGDVSNRATNYTPEITPFETIRFDGKNYKRWAWNMELFLKQLKLAYVLTDPYPSNSEADREEQKWERDECLCRHHILSSLSDHLYHHYSKQSSSAKKLWEELKLVYLDEEYGTIRAQVKKYIEFQMVEEKPVLEQVHELNNIAYTIENGNMLLDKNFHVSVIISKFPPSWKDFAIRLMRMEYLPHWSLMERVKAEENYRNQVNQSEISKFSNFGPGPRMGDIRRPGGTSCKRKEWERENNNCAVCWTCGMKGHISKFCQTKNFVKGGSKY